MAEKSKYICIRCGSPITRWQDGWKHANSGNSETRSCGKPPIPRDRAEYDAEMRELAESIVKRRP